ncbi:hypothetical protein [Sulfobacillus thermosulfidooxidans]|nr:hypothetical protein [Sulfobacillus thermosulfidooxidans]
MPPLRIGRWRVRPRSVAGVLLWGTGIVGGVFTLWVLLTVVLVVGAQP